MKRSIEKSPTSKSDDGQIVQMRIVEGVSASQKCVGNCRSRRDQIGQPDVEQLAPQVFAVRKVCFEVVEQVAGDEYENYRRIVEQILGHRFQQRVAAPSEKRIAMGSHDKENSDSPKTMNVFEQRRICTHSVSSGGVPAIDGHLTTALAVVPTPIQACRLPAGDMRRE